MSVAAITCARCSRIADRVDAPGWTRRGEHKGLPIGICGPCGLGVFADGEDKESAGCDGECKGGYSSKTGVYYRAEQSTGRYALSAESWACWDFGCVERWVNDEAPVECEFCGHDIDFDIWKYVNGKRTEMIS